MAIDPNSIPQSGDLAKLATQFGVSQAEIVKLRRQADANKGKVTGDVGSIGKLEQEAFAERQNLGGTEVVGTSTSFFDSGRGVTVTAPFGSHFEQLKGGGVRVVQGDAPSQDAGSASSLFAQPTRGTADGGTEATPGFTEEQLALPAVEGRAIKRTGQTFFDEDRGIDVHAEPGHILIEYEDGTIEQRPVSSITEPGEALERSAFGPSREELGLVDDDSAEAIEAKIKSEGNIATSELTLVGKESDGRTAGEGNVFFRAPDGTLLERPEQLAELAKDERPEPVGDDIARTFKTVFGREPNAQELEYWQSRTDKEGDSLVGAMQFHKQQGRTIGDQPPPTIDLPDPAGAMLSQFGLSADPESFAVNPVESFQDTYNNLLESMGLEDVRSQMKEFTDELEELDKQFADDQADIDENPWLSESLRLRKQDALQNKYDTERSQLVNRIGLLQSIDDRARDDARFIASAALDQYNKDRQFDLQQKQLLMSQVDQAFNQRVTLAELSLRDRQFESQREQFAQEFALQAARESRLGRGGGGGGTLTERGLFQLQQVQGVLFESTGEDGYVDPDVYGALRSQVLVSPAEFNARYGSFVNPRDRSRLGIGGFNRSQEDGKEFITHDWIKSVFPRDKLLEQAGVTFGGLFASRNSEEEAIDNYIREVMLSINSYRNAGLTDNEIFKLIK